MTSIEKITIPKSVEIIEEEAFFACKYLKEVLLEKGSKLKFISKYLFSCSDKLEKVEIPENSELKSICSCSFQFCPIKSLYIPSTVEFLGKGWCSYTSQLTNVEISPNNKNFKFCDAEKWCLSTGHLQKVTVSPNNKYFKYADKEHRMIVGKSSNDDENYNILVFADQLIKKMIIPEYVSIIYILGYNYNKLKILEFLGEELLSSCSFLNNCMSIVIASFPNVHKIIIGNLNFRRMDPKFTLYIAANAKIV